MSEAIPVTFSPWPHAHEHMMQQIGSATQPRGGGGPPFAIVLTLMLQVHAGVYPETCRAVAQAVAVRIPDAREKHDTYAQPFQKAARP